MATIRTFGERVTAKQPTQLSDNASAPQEQQTRAVQHEISLRSFFTVLAIVAALWVLARVWQSILICIIALVIAGTLSPVVAWMERRGLKRPIALTLVLLGLLAAVFGLGALVIPALVAQVSTIRQDAPQIQSRLADLMAGLPFLAGQADRIRGSNPAQYLDPASNYVVHNVGKAAQTVVLGFTTVVLAFYLIADHERVQGFLFSLLPRRFHLRTARTLLEMETVVGGYMRGQAITSLCIGVFTFAVLAATHTPNALALGILAAFGDLVPFVGPVLAVVPAVVFALVKSPGAAVIVLIALIVYQQFESHLLIPRVYGQSLRLSPVAVLVSLLLGGQLLGIVGALLALPLAAGIRVLVESYRIELPGEITGEQAERDVIEHAEAEYATQTEGQSAVDSAVVATAMAEQMQEDDIAETGVSEIPAEEQRSPPRVAPALNNPAR